MEEYFSYGRSGIRQFFKRNLVPILYTLIIHLVLLITFLFIRVDGLKKDQELGIRLEFEEPTLESMLEEMKEMEEVPADWLEQLMQQREIASNRAVNLNAENQFTEDISTDDFVQELLDQIEEARDQEDREKIEELQAILASADYVPPEPGGEDNEGSEYSGPTTITYEFLEEPRDRGKVNLSIPVYRCQGSGLVRVQVFVAPDGSVRDAEVLEPIEGTDRVCFSDAALAAALSSRFRIELNGPARHRAVITYTFIAQ
jgi:hypothetical protein